MEVDLAEHAVQLQIETGEEVAGAETEAGCENAGVAIGVCGDEIRGVAFRARPLERGEQRVDAGGGVEIAERRQPRERLGDA